MRRDAAASPVSAGASAGSTLLRRALSSNCFVGPWCVAMSLAVARALAGHEVVVATNLKVSHKEFVGVEPVWRIQV